MVLVSPKSITVTEDNPTIYSMAANNSEGRKYSFGYFCGRVREFSDVEEDAVDDGEGEGVTDGGSTELSHHVQEGEGQMTEGPENLQGV